MSLLHIISPRCLPKTLSYFLMTLCSPGAIHIQEKANSGAHKARKGLRKKCYDCTPLGPAAF